MQVKFEAGCEQELSLCEGLHLVRARGALDGLHYKRILQTNITNEKERLCQQRSVAYVRRVSRV